MNDSQKKMFEYLVGDGKNTGNGKKSGEVGMKTILKGDAAKKAQNAKGGYTMHGIEFPSMSGKSAGAGTKELKQEIEELRKQLKKKDLKIQELENRLEVEVPNARTEGHRQGETQGKELGYNRSIAEFKEEVQSLQQKVVQSLTSLSQERDDYFAELENSMQILTLSLIQKVFPSLVAQNQDAILDVVKQAMSFLGQDSELTVLVNPDEFHVVEQSESFWAPINAGLKKIEIKEDNRVGLGGCIIETASGTIDMRLESMIERLYEICGQSIHPEYKETADKVMEVSKEMGKDTMVEPKPEETIDDATSRLRSTTDEQQSEDEDAGAE